MLDAHGKIVWGRADIDGDPIVVVLTEQVRDAHLAGLRRDGVSYIFAGARPSISGWPLENLNWELGISASKLMAAALPRIPSARRAGRRDQPRDFPGRRRRQGAPCVFDLAEGGAGTHAPVRSITLESSEVLEGGVVWLHYRLENA